MMKKNRSLPWKTLLGLGIALAAGLAVWIYPNHSYDAAQKALAVGGEPEGGKSATQGKAERAATGPVTYIAAGGLGYLVLEAGPWGEIAVFEGYPIVAHEIWIGARGKARMSARLSGNDLVLDFNASTRDIGGGSDQHAESHRTMTLTPSSDRPGDWDLSGLAIQETIVGGGTIFSSRYWDSVWQADSWSEMFKEAGEPFASEDFLNGKLDPAKGPLKSFLHRIDDPRLAEFYRMRLGGMDDTATLPLIRKLDAAHPGDPWLLPQRVELEGRAGDLAEAGAAWARWQKAGLGAGDPLMSPARRAATASLETARLRKLHPELPSFSEAFPESSQYPLKDWTLERRMDWLRKAGGYDGLVYGNQPLVYPVLSSGFAGIRIPNFLELQTVAKVARTESVLLLLAGKREEGLEQLVGAYRLGQSMNANGTLIQRLIGIAVRSIAIGGLETYALNAYQTPEELIPFNAALARLDRTPGQENGETLMEGEIPPLMDQLTYTVNQHQPNMLEAATRNRVTDAKWSVLRTATGAWGKHLTDQQWPATAGDYSRWIPDGLPRDPFGAPDPIRFRADGEDLLVWSIGPDKKDDLGAISYDPSNGTASSGDIFLRIPSKSAYSFPKDGVHANTAGELLAQFPNGLPVDSFSSVKGMPFNILDATTTQPLVVFSWGPGMSQIEALNPGSTQWEGKSGADLQQVFERTYGDFSAPRSSPAAPKSSGRTELPRRRDGTWTLQPMYDPTNGTTSRGDLFLEIPRTSGKP